MLIVNREHVIIMLFNGRQTLKSSKTRVHIAFALTNTVVIDLQVCCTHADTSPKQTETLLERLDFKRTYFGCRFLLGARAVIIFTI